MRILLLLALFAFAVECEAQAVEQRLPTTFGGLRQLHGPQPSELCLFSPVTMSEDSSKAIVLGDSATLRLPSGWQTSPLQPGDDEYTLTRLVLPGGNRVLIRRERKVHGRPYLMYRPDELAEGTTCSLARDQAGAIWSLYPPDPHATPGVQKYIAIGDVITPAGLWYSITLWTTSSADQFRLAGILTEAMLLPQRSDSARSSGTLEKQHRVVVLYNAKYTVVSTLAHPGRL
jgi:hypothetical protein